MHLMGSRGKFLHLGSLVLFAAAASFLLFARLGHYALWDDEAMVALVAKGVLRTGDTSILPDDHNIVAYRNGLLVRDLHDRSTPPFATYLTAASFSLLGETPFAARLPFALFGLATLGLMAFWMWKARLPALHQLLIAIGMLCNVSFFLFSRQCRYYAPTFFFTVAVVFLYLHWRGRWQRLVLLSVLLSLLFATNYLAYAALAVCLAADYLIWRRREFPITFANATAFLLPQIVLIGLVASIWNPLLTQFGSYVAKNTLADRVTLFFWNLRDLNQCEFLVGVLVIAAPILGWIYRRPVLLRMSLGLLIYIFFITLASPQLRHGTQVADVRYLIAVIPLCVAMEAEVILLLTQRCRQIIIPLALLIFGTNLFHGGPFLRAGLRSTISDYIGELIAPPSDPFTTASAWIEGNIKTGSSVFVTPSHMAYPLMLRQPGLIYAWQLQYPPAPQFKEMQAIHFMGRSLPDYLITFGPFVGETLNNIEEWKKLGISYEYVTTIEHYWLDVHRPELFWRKFRQVQEYDPNREAIYVFRRNLMAETLRDSSSRPR